MKVHELFAYLRVRDAAAALEFYARAFGATEKFRLTGPGGRVGHAELLFGDFVVMLSEEYPELGLVGPATLGGNTSSVHLHVDDCDAWAERAIAAGATLVRGPADQFYGERSATVRDPFGHEWMLGHEIEAVTPEEMQRRYDELMKG